jgi:hypothetical protein
MKNMIFTADDDKFMNSFHVTNAAQAKAAP